MYIGDYLLETAHGEKAFVFGVLNFWFKAPCNPVQFSSVTEQSRLVHCVCLTGRDNAFHALADVQFVAAMAPPGGGRSFVSNRYLRHFSMVALTKVKGQQEH